MGGVGLQGTAVAPMMIRAEIRVDLVKSILTVWLMKGFVSRK